MIQIGSTGQDPGPYPTAADPAEAHNLIADPATQEVLRDLRSRLLTWMRRNGDPALSWPAKAVSPAR